MPGLMIQGCGSDVGKSVLAAGLCRALVNRGLQVRPFKPQNMSNNAAVTATGGEIGRAQWLQAIACRAEPEVRMNPVLLKPQSDTDAQVVVLGKVVGTYSARDYQIFKRQLLETVLASYRSLEASCDLVIAEGAGSPAEINLRDNDIANMGFAIRAGVSVVLVGDIDRGHVIAALIGAHTVLAPNDLKMIGGFIVNKFRGDPLLFEEGRRMIVQKTGWRDLGLVPWISGMAHLPAEDAITNPDRRQNARLRIAVPLLSRIANFDEFDALRAEEHVDFQFIPPGRPIPCDIDLVILPGSKATLADMRFLREQGWHIDILAHVRRGGHVLGVCGGYQMLGGTIADPDGIEGAPGTEAGLALLDIDTALTGAKVLNRVSGTLSGSAAAFSGYEMHMGRTIGPGTKRPFLRFDNGLHDGAISENGRVYGCYVHGLFAHPETRRALLGPFGVATSGRDQAHVIDAVLDEIAAALEQALDIKGFAQLAGIVL